MTTIVRLWLPEDLKQFVEHKVRQGGYISSPEYLRDLIRQHRGQKTGATTRKLTQEAWQDKSAI